ncbi:MAG TPA: transposase [Gaiellaceae bacterium]|nr:transposase [Gaiellaceae bacterium]
MPRRPRTLLGDGTYHVTARGVAASEIFLDVHDFRAFLVLYGDVVSRFGWSTRVFCLMPNHYHLVLAATRPNLSAGMHRLNCLYAMRFNRRYDRPGHLFQNRFDARLVEGDRHIRAVCRYVLRNPVRAGLVDHWRQWPWSGLGAI